MGEYCIYSVIAQPNTTLPDAYLEPSQTSTMELLNNFGKKFYPRQSTMF